MQLVCTTDGDCTSVRYAVVMYHTHKACNQNLDNCVDMFFEIYVERVI